MGGFGKGCAFNERHKTAACGGSGPQRGDWSGGVGDSPSFLWRRRHMAMSCHDTCSVV